MYGCVCLSVYGCLCVYLHVCVCDPMCEWWVIPLKAMEGYAVPTLNIHTLSLAWPHILQGYRATIVDNKEHPALGIV